MTTGAERIAVLSQLRGVCLWQRPRTSWVGGLHLVPYLHEFLFSLHIYRNPSSSQRTLLYVSKEHRWGWLLHSAFFSLYKSQSNSGLFLSLPFSLCLPEEGDRVAAEARPGSSADCPGAAKERTSASSPDGGVGVARSAAAYHGQYQRQILPHHGGPAVRPEHLTSHGLRLWYRPLQGEELIELTKRLPVDFILL